MEGALRVRSLRARLLAENVANADTPNYLGRDVRFEAALKEMLGRPAADGPSVITRAVAPEDLRADGNGIDVNKALGRVYENALGYFATLKLYGDSLARLKASANSA
jgi:flagellar basal-body rod protein FlgB